MCGITGHSPYGSTTEMWNMSREPRGTHCGIWKYLWEFSVGVAGSVFRGTMRIEGMNGIILCAHLALYLVLFLHSMFFHSTAITPSTSFNAITAVVAAPSLCMMTSRRLLRLSSWRPDPFCTRHDMLRIPVHYSHTCYPGVVFTTHCSLLIIDIPHI